MKLYKKILLILSPTIIVLLILGISYLTYDIRVQININKMENENELFYDLLIENDIDVNEYVLYEEVFKVNDLYYVIFTEESTSFLEEGYIIQGLMIEVDADIITEYKTISNIEVVDNYYILPSLWIAGGGSSILSAQAFYKRAELRRLIIENSSSLTLYDIIIKIEGSYCLGKLEY